jgi:hypothetical protein
MNQSAMRLFVRSLIAEAKEAKEAKKETGLPKSSGKLVDLKKELAALKTMKDELQAAKFAEKTSETEVEFANLAKFAKELDKIKAGGVALEASIDTKITELEDKIKNEKNKIMELIGLTPKGGQEKMVDEKKELNEGQIIRILKDFKLDNKDFKKGDHVGTQPDFDNIIKAKEKGTDYTIAIGGFKNEARFKKGTDIGKKNTGKNTGFKELEKKTAKEYGSKEVGAKVAGKKLQQILAKKK